MPAVFSLFLACPLMMFFMMQGMQGTTGSETGTETGTEPGSPESRPAPPPLKDVTRRDDDRCLKGLRSLAVSRAGLAPLEVAGRVSCAPDEPMPGNRGTIALDYIPLGGTI